MSTFTNTVKSPTALIALTMTCLSPLPLFAADDDEGAEYVIDEIMVTATRREQPLQAVPISLSAVGEIELEQRGVDELGEFFRVVPGIQYTDFGTTGRRGERNVTLRGIVGVGAGGPLVGYYIDEVPLPVSDPLLFDVSRVEVLRGPQGTLYGAGTAGGTIKIVTNKPDADEFDSRIDASASSTLSGGTNYGFKGMVNIPLAENAAALRLVGYYEDADGYIDSIIAPAGSAPEVIANSPAAAEDDFNSVERRGVRATLQLAPSDRLTITPMLQIHRADMGGEANHYPTLGDLQIIREVNTTQESDFDLFNITVNYELDTASFISASSYFNTEYAGVEDLSNNVRSLAGAAIGLSSPDPAPFFLDTTKNGWVQEFRLVSTAESRLRWTAGLFYQEHELEDNSTVTATNLTVPGTSIIAVPELEVFSADRDDRTEEFAAFGEVYFDINDSLTLTLGARWFDYTLETRVNSSGAFGAGPGELRVAEERDIRPKVALAYQITDDHLVFASASKGFRTGGVSDPVPDIDPCNIALAEAGYSEAPTDFDADVIWNYEIGTKTSWADNRFIANVTAFYIDWSNIGQALNLRDFGDGTCAFSPTVNAGEASSKGVEVESRIRPSDALSFGVSVAYTDATLGANSAIGAEGENIPNVPELTTSISGEYSFSFTNSLDGFIRADYQYVDERIGEETLLESYDLTNVRIGIGHEDWTLSLFGNNLGDSRPALGDRSFGYDFLRFTTLRPRSIGLNYSKSF